MENGVGESSKKRRREETNATGENMDSATVGTPASKHKKSKKEHATPVMEVKEGTTSSIAPPITLLPKQKTMKRKTMPAENGFAVEDAVDALAAPVDTLGMLPRASPQLEAAEVAKKKKKAKKVKAERRDSAEQTAAEINGISATGPVLLASAEKLAEPVKAKNKHKKKDQVPAAPQHAGIAHTDGSPKRLNSNGIAHNKEPIEQPTMDIRVDAAASTATAIDNKLLQSKSPFIQQTASFYLPLSPIAHHFPLQGLCAEHLSPLLLTYYPPLKGIVLSFSNLRMSEEPEEGVQVKSVTPRMTVLGKSTDEYAVIFVWLIADLIIFKPRKGTVLEGFVNLQNESLLGLICYNYFNAGIERSRLPKDWQWVEDEKAAEGTSEVGRRGRRSAAGYYVDGQGQKIEGRVVFRVNDFEATADVGPGGGSINIFGTVLSPADDEKVDEDARQKGLGKDKQIRK